jgi:hypothetical protein
MTVRDQSPSPRRLAVPVVGATVIALLFMWVFGIEAGHPTPHSLPIAVQGDPGSVAQIKHGLSVAAPGTFDVKNYADLPTARAALNDRKIYGIFSLSASPALYIATAEGTAPAQVVSAAFTGFAATSGQHLSVIDVAKPPKGDSQAVLAAFLMIAMTIAGVAFYVIGALVGADRRRGQWIASAAAFAVVVGFLVTAVANWGFGAFPGHALDVGAIAALLALATTLGVGAFRRVAGPAGLPLAGLVLIPVGMAAGGGLIDRFLLPDPYKALSLFTPGGAAIDAIRGVAYFHNAAIGRPLLILLVWTVLGLAGLTLARRGGGAAVAASPVSGETASGRPVSQESVSQESPSESPVPDEAASDRSVPDPV